MNGKTRFDLSRRFSRHASLGLAVALGALGFLRAAHGQDQCGALTNAFGPFDYSDPLTHTPAKLGIVEGAHFTPEVEQLVRGASSVNPLDDLDYTLRAFPNHHRALYSLAKYYLKFPNVRGRYSLDCWFERAARFNSSDGVVPAIYGVYLAKKGERNQALEQYQKAIELLPDFAEAHYNLGLLYIDLKKYDLANQQAGIAYKLGFPLPGLRKRLQELGAWNPAAAE